MEYKGYSTIYDYLKNVDIPDGIHSMQLANDEIIDFEVYNYLEDTEFDETPILGDDIPDTKMLILKFHKNLTINAGVTITPQVRKKGMTIYCNGIIENNGIISMTARGANALGQDVLLYQNADGSYEFVPKVGANGGAASFTGHLQLGHGVKGADGLNRQSGGGGSGASRTWRSTGRGYSYSGAGATGTSYSGGSGGGGIYLALNSNSNNYYAGSGGINGGAGGFGWAQQGNSSPVLYCGGGAGNNGGSGEYSRSGNARTKYSPVYGQNGTGGLLIIITKKLINKGSVSANGCNGGACNLSSGEGEGGGASGGGSINIFYKYIDNTSGKILANGGEGGYFAGGTGLGRGGTGGNGCITLTDISPRYYFIKYNNQYLYYTDNEWKSLNNRPQKKDFFDYGIKNLSLIPKEEWSKLNGKKEIIMLTDTEKDNYINSKFIPKPQVILNKKPVNLPLTKSVKSMINNITGALNIPFIISINRSKSWLYFDDGWKIFSFLNSPPKEINLENSFEWQNWFDNVNDKDIENIKLLGLTQQQLSSGKITQEQWDNILPYDNYNKSIVFLSLMYTDSYDIVETNKISIIQDKYGYYKENRNYNQRQETNKLIIIPQFNSQQIKINYTL